MPIANLTKPPNLSAAASHGALERTDSNFLSESSVPYMRILTKQRTNRTMETRQSELNVGVESYGKPTKSFEYRRRANLAKARKIAVKLENHKKYSDLPTITAIKTPSSATTTPSVRTEQQPSKRSPREKKTAKTASENMEKKSPASKPPTSLRRTGGGISNLHVRAKEITLTHIMEPRQPRHKHVECQTSASDLINWQVLGDAKVMYPSPALWTSILKKRDDELRRSMLKEERFVPEYSKSEVNYQTNLKEFLETGVVRHYDREFESQHQEKLKPKSTKSDDFKRALRYKPKVQPEMDLKKRLPKIEEELLRAYKGRS